MSADEARSVYRRRLLDMANASDSRVVFNKNLNHASIVIATIIEKSSDYIYIITNDLGQDIYCTAEIMTALRDFVLRKDSADIKIISRDNIEINHPWKTDEILQKHQDQISFLQLPQNWDIKYYFVLGDSKNFRLDHNSDHLLPVVQFGNTKTGTHLKDQFEQLEVELKERRRHKAA